MAEQNYTAEDLHAKWAKEMEGWIPDNISEGTMKILNKQYGEKWIPQFKGYNPVASPNVGASKKMVWKVWLSLADMGYDPENITINIANRADGKVREMGIREMDKGTAWDLIKAIKKGQVKQFIK